jgi:hypothetical protein
MKKATPGLIGKIGERLAMDYLTERGYLLAQFDKSSPTSAASLPFVNDYGVGYSFGYFGIPCYIQHHGNWVDSNTPKWVDVPFEMIKSCAKRCRAESDCGIRDRNRGSAPCSNIDSFLSKEWLCSISPKCNGPFIESVVRKGNVVVGECLRRFGLMIFEDYKKRFLQERNFVLFNQLTSVFIQNTWAEWSRNNPLPYSGEDFRTVMDMPSGDELAEMMKTKNRVALARFPDGHPGRFDWFGMNNGEYCAIEVKTNSAQLNYWQSVRFGILEAFGYNTLLVHVEISKEKIKESMVAGKDSADRIEIIKNPEQPKSVKIPTLDEFISVLNLKSYYGDPMPIFY